MIDGCKRLCFERIPSPSLALDTGMIEGIGSNIVYTWIMVILPVPWSSLLPFSLSHSVRGAITQLNSIPTRDPLWLQGIRSDSSDHSITRPTILDFPLSWAHLYTFDIKVWRGPSNHPRIFVFLISGTFALYDSTFDWTATILQPCSNSLRRDI